MAFSDSKFVGFQQLSLFREQRFVFRNPVRVIPALSTKEKESPALQTLMISRRDTVLYLSAEALLCWSLSVFSTEPAEARVGRKEMKKRVMEKLQKLKEQARTSQPKTEDGAKKVPYGAKKVPSSQPSLIPFLSPQSGATGPLFKATKIPE